MKILALVLLFSISAFAQNTSTMRLNSDEYSDVSSRGFRIGVVKPSLEWKTQVNTTATIIEAEDKVDDTIGFSLGYAYLPVLSLGVTTNLTYLDLHKEDAYLGIGRLDINAALALTSFLNVKAGANVSKIFNKNNQLMESAQPEIGYQGSVGLQITPNVGLDLGYTVMKQKGTGEIFVGTATGDFNFEYTQSGYEAALHATF